MLKHRLSKISKAAFIMLCALFVGGTFQSCEDTFDDYSYDDGGEPSWLGESVYDFLRNNDSGHTYNYYASIIDAMGEQVKEEFSRTGSKTIFVADDEAFERFFENNSWGVSSFEELTLTQKKVILNASMLDDAMLLDMLSATSAKEADEGTCMRRKTAYDAVDSIPIVTAAQTPKYNKYWDALRGKERDESMRLAMDGTSPMMVHFLPDFLKNKGITEEDISFLLRKNGVQVKTYKKGEVYIYDKKVVRSDVPADGFSDDTMTITCKNGYLYRLDDVLIPPSNMAEEIRRREDTQVFSHILDRYCLPVYDKDLSETYLSVTGKNDSIFRLRYYTKSGGGGILIDNAILKEVDRPASEENVLLFDPGWNEYSNGAIGAQNDMAAMLVPTDDAMFEYFTDGPGSLIMQEYNSKEDLETYVEIADKASLMLALNRVPDNLIAKLINNLMQKSFTSTVPSRFDKITDDGNDEIVGIKEAVTECVIANNGVIYIINEVFGPSAYSTVAAPAEMLDNMLIIRNVISQLGYNSFLLAKQATYSLFLPDDGSFIYYDPVSIYANEVNSTKKPTAYQFFYDKNHPDKNDKKYLYAKMYEFDPETYEVDPETMEYTAKAQVVDLGTSGMKFFNGTGSTTNLAGILYNRMSDLIDYLIVVDDITTGKKYYKAKNGGALVVDMSNPAKPIFQGGEQVENGHHVTAKAIYADQLNGASYNTVQFEEPTTTQLYSGLPTPSTKSLYKQVRASVGEVDENDAFVIDDNAPFSEFYKLMDPTADGYDLETLLLSMFPDAQANKVKSDSMKNYSVFYTAKTNNETNGTMINGVPIFSGYNYTVYIPSNEAVKEFVNSGMPVWEDIDACAKGTGSYASQGPAPLQAAAAMRQLRDFIRYHFQDNSIFVDNNSIDAEYETQTIGASGTYLRVGVKAGNGSIAIDDECENSVANVIAEAGMENKTWNLLCRDFEFKATGKAPVSIVRSSFSVAHLVDNVLKFKALYGYDGLIQRFAKDGERVGAMKVEGNTSDGLYTDTEGNNLYLVAEQGTGLFTNEETGLTVSREIGYLMAPRTGGFTKMAREDYVLVDGAKVLVANDGYRVVRGEYDSKTKRYAYSYYVDEEGNKLKYANNGEVIEKTPANPTSDEENNTDVVE